MPIRHTRRALAVVALLFAVRPTSLLAEPPRVILAQGEENTYTVQQGDTLSGIARKFGLHKDAIVRVNDLAHPDRLAAGCVLRLPVTEATASQNTTQATPVAAKATDVSLTLPAATTTNLRPEAQSSPEDAPPAASAQKAPPLPAPGPVAPGKATASPVIPPVQPQPAAAPPLKHIDIDQLATGFYKHPGLGMLRLSQREGGLTLAKDNVNIPMRHLLYGIYDGTDTSGNIHNIQLVFDAAGRVEALRYSSAGTGQITFDKVQK